jgi:hypothetical protein
MADTNYVIAFKAELQNIKKAFRELEQSQKKFDKTRKVQVTSEDKAAKQQQKDVKTAFAAKDKSLRNQLAIQNKLFQLSNTEYKLHEREFVKKTKREQKAVRDQAQEAKRLQRQSGGRGMFGGGPGGGQSFNQRAGGALTTGAALIGGGILGMLFGAAIKGYEKRQQMQQTLAPSIGMGFGSLNRVAGRSQGRLGFTQMEGAQMIGTMGRATGTANIGQLQAGMRATGMEAGEVGGVFGTLRQAGMSFGKPGAKDSSGARMFSKMIAGGMYSGLEKARLPEYFQSVTKLTEEQNRIQAGAVDQTDTMKLLSILGKKGGVGFQGARGGEVLSGIGQAISSPGGGAYGEAFARRALQKPGMSFWEVEKQREKGATDIGNVQAYLAQLKKEGGTTQTQAAMLNTFSGGAISKTKSEELIKIADSSLSQEEQTKEMGQVLEGTKSLEEQALAEYKKAGVSLSEIVKDEAASLKHGAQSAALIEGISEMTRTFVNTLFDIAIHLGELVKKVGIVIDFLMGNKSPQASAAMAQSEKDYKALLAEKDPAKKEFLRTRALQNARNAARAYETQAQMIEEPLETGTTIKEQKEKAKLEAKFGKLSRTNIYETPESKAAKLRSVQANQLALKAAAALDLSKPVDQSILETIKKQPTFEAKERVATLASKRKEGQTVAPYFDEKGQKQYQLVPAKQKIEVSVTYGAEAKKQSVSPTVKP